MTLQNGWIECAFNFVNSTKLVIEGLVKMNVLRGLIVSFL